MSVSFYGGGGGGAIPTTMADWVQIATTQIETSYVRPVPANTSAQTPVISANGKTYVQNGAYATTFNYSGDTANAGVINLSGLTRLKSVNIRYNNALLNPPIFTGLAQLWKVSIASNTGLLSPPNFSGVVFSDHLGVAVGQVNLCSNTSMLQCPSFDSIIGLKKAYISGNTAMGSGAGSATNIDFNGCSGLDYANINGNPAMVYPPNFDVCGQLKVLVCKNNVTMATAPDLGSCPLLQRVFMYGNTAMTTGPVLPAGANAILTTLYLYGCAITNVVSYLAYLDGTGKTNCELQIQGGTNQAVSPSNASRLSLIAKGWTITHN
jgi:hypothetical protein